MQELISQASTSESASLGARIARTRHTLDSHLGLGPRHGATFSTYDAMDRGAGSNHDRPRNPTSRPWLLQAAYAATDRDADSNHDHCLSWTGVESEPSLTP